MIQIESLQMFIVSVIEKRRVVAENYKNSEPNKFIWLVLANRRKTQTQVNTS